jgi:hypothetical protein
LKYLTVNMSAKNNGGGSVLLLLLLCGGFTGLIVTTPTETNKFNGDNKLMSFISVTDGYWRADSDSQPAPIRSLEVDNTVLIAGSPSWKLPMSPLVNPVVNWNDIDCAVFHSEVPIKPGDVIVFSATIQITSPTVAGDVVMAGGRIGIDIYGAVAGVGSGARFAIDTPDGAGIGTPASNTYVPFGTAGLTTVTITFTVPATYTANSEANGFPIGTVFTPNVAVVWLQTWSGSNWQIERGTAWFGDLSFVINPVDETPLIHPTFSTLTVSDTSIFTDEPVSCTITLTGVSGTPTGTVTFLYSKDGALYLNQIGVPVALDAGGAATSINFYPSFAGTYTIKAEYSGDSVYTTEMSTASTLTVDNPVVVASPAMLGLLGAVFTRAEQQNVGDSYWDRGLWDDGMWEHDTPFINLRKEMEKH